MTHRTTKIVLSYGAGVQSTALLVMSNLGDHGVPRADLAIFADTKDEPGWVYDQLEWAKSWSKIPVETVTAGRLSDRWESGGAFIPAFTGNGGMLNRVCTERFKVRPIVNRLRGHGQVTLMLGISLDEAHRMKPNAQKWITNTWPLIAARLTREQCQRYLESRGIERPKKSACVYCPFHSDSHWLDLKTNHPAEWDRAVAFDEKIRNGTKSVKWAAYLHKSMRPLPEVDLNENQIEMFGNECEGMCGV